MPEDLLTPPQNRVRTPTSDAKLGTKKFSEKKFSEKKFSEKNLSENGGAGNSAQAIVEDIFRRASQMGGFFVVSFIAPVSAAVGSGQTNQSPMEAAVSAVAGEAAEINRELLTQIKANMVQPPKTEKP